MKKTTLLFLLLFVNSLFAKATELEHVKLQLQWKHQFEFAGFYAAKEKGYYRDVGLDVEFLEDSSDEKIIDVVLDKKADFGLSYSSLVVKYKRGKPLVLLANFFKQSPLVLITQKNIHSLKQLFGKKIMGVSNEVDTLTIKDMLKKSGLTNGDYVSIKTDYSLKRFINKEIDAMTVFTTNEIYFLNKMGIEYNVFDPTVYGIKYYDLNLFTTKEEIEKHPRRAENFKLASIKGWKYALSHKEEIAHLIQKKYNSQDKSFEALMFEAQQIESIMLPKIYPIGSIDTCRINSISESFEQAGFIDKNSPYEISDFIMGSNFFDMCIDSQQKAYYKKLFFGFLAFLGLVFFFMAYKNHITNKLNRELEVKIAKAIEETQKKDTMLFEQSKLSAMGEMIENIAHQWRQPLSQINSSIMSIDFLLEDKEMKDKEIEAKLAEIESTTLYMSKTISDFRNYYDKNKEKKSFNLYSLIEQSLVIINPTLKAYDIDVVIKGEDNLRLYNYPNELKQVILVILSNAKDAFSQDATVSKNKKIVISLDQDNENYYINICDNGAGIKGNIEKIFEPYYTTKHKSQGTGLGLYICKLLLIDSLGGNISAKNNTKNGACFEIILRKIDE